MASTLTPYGFRAVNELGGLPYAGSTRSFLIDPAGYNTNIFNGSIVRINANGYINIVLTTGADDSANVFPAGTIGIFVGCTYTNAQGQIIYSQYYPANTASVQGSSITAYVIDDDRAVFSVQANGSITQAELGQNVFLSAVQSTSTGSTTTGNSTTAVSATSQTATAAFRIVGFPQNVNNAVGDDYTEILVKFNPGYHSYSNAVGI
jgi:hypothetical protein